jgi:tryptophanase
MIAQGLTEVTDPDYLRSRADAAGHLARLVRAAGVDIVEPAGLHALYLNAGRLLPHIPPHHYPGHALACRLYLEGGIRSVELGSLYLGAEDAHGAPVRTAPYELLRLALPRRTYTHSHLDHVGHVLRRVAERADEVHGYRIVEQPPVLRHFKARLEPVRPVRPVQPAQPAQPAQPPQPAQPAHTTQTTQTTKPDEPVTA